MTWNGNSYPIVVDPAVFYTPSGGTGAWTCKSQLPRWVDNGDGSVTDNLTGLMWMKTTSACVGEITCYTNTWVWINLTEVTDLPNGPLFSVFLTDLNGGDSYFPDDQLIESGGGGSPCFANHCDWRIPTLAELETIVFVQCSAPDICPATIDQAFGPTQTHFYWTASSDSSIPRNGGGFLTQAWIVNFADGSHVSVPKGLSEYARAVRTTR